MNSLLVLSLLAMWPFSSGKEFHMKAFNSVPAASGTVKVEKGKDNGNTKLDIKVERLANPSNLTPPENAYLVWILPHGTTDAVKQGAIRVGKDLNGELKTVTVSKDFDVFITAEKSDSASVPSDFRVLDAHITMH